MVYESLLGVSFVSITRLLISFAVLSLSSVSGNLIPYNRRISTLLSGFDVSASY